MNDDRNEVNIDSGNGFCWAGIPAQEPEKKADDIILSREGIIGGLDAIKRFVELYIPDMTVDYTTGTQNCHVSTETRAINVLRDAIRTIEKEKPVKPEPIKGGSINWMVKQSICAYKCPVCGDYIAKGDKYCDCGLELTWEGV